MECCLDFFSRSALDQAYHRVIRHHRLRVLSIKTSRKLQLLFENLSLPALSAFSYYRTRILGSQAILTSFASLLSRSACSLSSLRLTCVFNELEDCLRLSPSLSEIELRGECARTSLRESLLDQLTRKSSENGHKECLLPNLRVVKLNIHCNSIGEALANMIESRRRFDTREPLRMFCWRVYPCILPPGRHSIPR